MNSKPILLFLLALAASVSIFLIFQNKKTSEPEKEYVSGEDTDRQEFIFLLQYIGRDYQYAVDDGVVINEFEYREMVAFCQRAIDLYLTFQPDLHQNLALFQLQELRQMVYEKADRYSVWDLTKTLIRDLTKELDMETFPATAPEIGRGKDLYKAGGCDVCHGAGGAGDGRVAEWLEPGPGSFREAAAMNEATPYQFFNAIRLGVAGTAMPSYQEAFSRQEVWDIAFYLMALRDGFDPHSTGDRPGITLKDLATKSNFDLLQEMKDRQQSIEPITEAQNLQISAVIDFLRSHPENIK